MVAFRLSHYAGQYCSEEGEDFLLYFRQRALAPRLVLYFTWVVLLPFFCLLDGDGNLLAHGDLANLSKLPTRR